MILASTPSGDEPEAAPFRTVAEVARLCRVSKMTLYRAIAAGRFPAVRIEGRLIVPAKVVEAMAQAALTGNTTVDAADWVRRDDATPVHNALRAGER
jgi:excisionase family DNA binding protein